MARTGTLQAAFTSGEISPRLYGRADWQRYASAAEAIENFIVRPEGGVMRRHGTRFAGETKYHAKKSLMVPFVVSTVQPYALEFGDGEDVREKVGVLEAGGRLDRLEREHTFGDVGEDLVLDVRGFAGFGVRVVRGFEDRARAEGGRHHRERHGPGAPTFGCGQRCVDLCR